MTFRQECAVAAMREILRGSCAQLGSVITQDRFIGGWDWIGKEAFAIADAMVKAAGPEPSTYGAAPSRSVT